MNHLEDILKNDDTLVGVKVGRSRNRLIVELLFEESQFGWIPNGNAEWAALDRYLNSDDIEVRVFLTSITTQITGRKKREKKAK